MELSNWNKDESWMTYKMVLQMYDKVSEKKPAGKFNDLITALKKSGSTDLTEPLMDGDDVRDQPVRHNRHIHQVVGDQMRENSHRKVHHYLERVPHGTQRRDGNHR